MGLHAQFGLLNRKAIAEEIERLIGLLDAADASSEDLEEEEDAGIEDDWRGEAVGHMGQGLLPDLPIYGIDQSAGPTNIKEAERRYDMRLRMGR